VLQRGGRASMFSPRDVASGKGWASVGMGVASRTLLQAQRDRNSSSALSATPPKASSATDRRRRDQGRPGQRAGAAGSERRHGEEEEAVCIAGVEAAGLATGLSATNPPFSGRFQSGDQPACGRPLVRCASVACSSDDWRA